MRRYLALVVALLFACNVHANGGTLRVGNQVLVAGDSAARVIELLGKPSYRSHAKSTPSGRSKGKKSARSSSSSDGEQWQYRQGSRVVTIVVANGKVTSISDEGR